MEQIGMPANEASSTDEKVGEERLGSSSLFESFGATLLLGTIVFILILVVIVIVIIVVRRTRSSLKCRERVQKIKLAIFFNPIIRYLVLNSLKLNMQAVVAVKATGGSIADFASSIGIIVLINGSPLIFYIVLNRNHDNLEDKQRQKSYGALYIGKNVTSDNHKAQFYPMIFFWRRLIFIIVTVYLFDYPLMQMFVHFALNITMMAILLYDERAFSSKGQRYVEIGSELGLHFTSIMLSLFMNASYDSEQKDAILNLTLGIFGSLIIGNAAYILWFTVNSCIEKLRMKRLEQLKKKYQEASIICQIKKAGAALEVIVEEENEGSDYSPKNRKNKKHEKMTAKAKKLKKQKAVKYHPVVNDISESKSILHNMDVIAVKIEPHG